jgi:hypothetical protein
MWLLLYDATCLHGEDICFYGGCVGLRALAGTPLIVLDSTASLQHARVPRAADTDLWGTACFILRDVAVSVSIRRCVASRPGGEWMNSTHKQRMFNLRWIAYPDLTDESISANLASINTSDHNNRTNNTDIRQKKCAGSRAACVYAADGKNAFQRRTCGRGSNLLRKIPCCSRIRCGVRLLNRRVG